VLDWARRIVGDSRAMRQELEALRHGLTGRLRIAAIPTTLAMVASLTTPFRMRPSQRSVHDPVAYLDRGADTA
jgi:DNA-binding transcriptional LysR family regulator